MKNNPLCMCVCGNRAKKTMRPTRGWRRLNYRPVKRTLFFISSITFFVNEIFNFKLTRRRGEMQKQSLYFRAFVGAEIEHRSRNEASRKMRRYFLHVCANRFRVATGASQNERLTALRRPKKRKIWNGSVFSLTELQKSICFIRKTISFI